MKHDSGVACISPSQLIWSRTSDFIELTKPKLTLLVLFTTFAGFCIGIDETVSPLLLVHTLAGTALMAGGAGALNMYSERLRDAMMKRTSHRPLAAGRLRKAHGLSFALVISAAGFAYLALFVNHLTGFISAAILAGYLFLYTPLKTKTWLSTLVGAVPGALPIVMGWTAANGELSSGAWVLFGIVYLWQIPHFYAIGWIHREDYARAGLPVLSVVDATGKRTARQVLLVVSFLILVSLVPVLTVEAGAIYMAAAAILGLIFLGYGICFSRSRDQLSARRLFIYSAAYLPVLLLVLVVSVCF